MPAAGVFPSLGAFCLEQGALAVHSFGFGLEGCGWLVVGSLRHACDENSGLGMMHPSFISTQSISRPCGYKVMAMIHTVLPGRRFPWPARLPKLVRGI